MLDILLTHLGLIMFVVDIVVVVIDAVATIVPFVDVIIVSIVREFEWP